MKSKSFSIMIDKKHDRIIILSVYEFYKDKLPESNIKWMIRLLRNNYRLNGMIRVKIENKLPITKGDIYKVIISDFRHNYTDYNPIVDSERRNMFANHGLMRAVYNNNGELIDEALSSLDEEKKIPRFRGKYFPN